MRGLADWSTKRIFDVVAEENQPYVGRRLSDIADEQGRDPFDVLCDIAVADDLLTSFGPDAPDVDAPRSGSSGSTSGATHGP